MYDIFGSTTSHLLSSDVLLDVLKSSTIEKRMNASRCPDMSIMIQLKLETKMKMEMVTTTMIDWSKFQLRKEVIVPWYYLEKWGLRSIIYPLGQSTKRNQEALREGASLIHDIALVMVMTMVKTEVRWILLFASVVQLPMLVLLYAFMLFSCTFFTLFFLLVFLGVLSSDRRKKKTQQRSDDEEYDKYFEGMFLWKMIQHIFTGRTRWFRYISTFWQFPQKKRCFFDISIKHVLTGNMILSGTYHLTSMLMIEHGSKKTRCLELLSKVVKIWATMLQMDGEILRMISF
jgi:hypothetical protein